MLIIPVIDLIDGHAVLARGGDRSRYQRLNTALCPSSEPHAVVEALLRRHPFPCIYVADLDAIRRRGDNRHTLDMLKIEFPDVQLWVDAGITDRDSLRAFLDRNCGRPVLGSESMCNLQTLVAVPDSAASVLSLDFKGQRLLGHQDLLTHSHLWPDQVVVMSLDRIGGGRGPDIDRIVHIRDSNPHVQLYAAGGVRGNEDLRTLADLGLSGALVATALHQGRIDLDRFTNHHR